jgi:uncharacterized integral membrane protein
MKALRILFAVIILVLLFIFTVNNIQTVQLTFLGYSAVLPLFLVIVTAFVFGFLLAALFGVVKGSQLRRQIRQLEKENQTMRMEKERRQAFPPPGT